MNIDEMEMLILDNTRVKQIMESLGVINVLYHGEPVWIEQIKQNNMVLVHYIDNQKLAEVPANLLKEDEN